MKLLQAGPSPFARKVKVTAMELGIELEEVGVVARPDQPDPTLVGQNPLGQIPCLVMDDGGSLFDSRSITRFLDAQAGGSLYPEGAWEVLTLEAMCDGIMDAAVAMVYERRFRAPEMVSNDFLSWQWGKVSRALDALDEYWVEYLSNGLTIGHISAGCALGYLDFRHGDRNWRDGRENLAKWFEGFGARSSMASTVPAD